MRTGQGRVFLACRWSSPVTTTERGEERGDPELPGRIQPPESLGAARDHTPVHSGPPSSPAPAAPTRACTPAAPQQPPGHPRPDTRLTVHRECVGRATAPGPHPQGVLPVALGTELRHRVSWGVTERQRAQWQRDWVMRSLPGQGLPWAPRTPRGCRTPAHPLHLCLLTRQLSSLLTSPPKESILPRPPTSPTPHPVASSPQLARGCCGALAVKSPSNPILTHFSTQIPLRASPLELCPPPLGL